MHVNLMKDYPIPSEISGWNDIIRLAISSTDIHVAKVIRSLILGM